MSKPSQQAIENRVRFFTVVGMSEKHAREHVAGEVARGSRILEDFEPKEVAR